MDKMTCRESIHAACVLTTGDFYRYTLHSPRVTRRQPRKILSALRLLCAELPSLGRNIVDPDSLGKPILRNEAISQKTNASLFFSYTYGAGRITSAVHRREPFFPN